MNEEFEDLIYRYLNDECSEEERRMLQVWMKEKPEHADEFMRRAAMHANLRAFVVGEQVVRKSEVESVTRLPAESLAAKVIEIPWRTVTLAVAACFMVLVAIWPEREPVSQPARSPVAKRSIDQRIPHTSDPRPAAEWVHTEGVIWRGDSADDGDKIQPGEIAIIEGEGRLRFDHGVEVSLHGPVEFKIVSLEKTYLKSGRLTVRVPAGAEGFTVLTKHLEVVDLGTHFGVQVDENDLVDVAVMEGRVSVKARRGEDSRVLNSGAAVRSNDGLKLAVLDITTLPFATAWRSAVGIKHHSKSVVIRPVRSFGNAALLSNTEIYVAAEGETAQLRDALEVDVSAAGEYRRESDLTEKSLSAGTMVRPYLIQFRPQAEKSAKKKESDWVNLRGEITFEGTVLGVILNHERLIAAERILNRRLQRKLYGKNRGLDFLGPKFGDSVTLSEDRQTLTVELKAKPGYSDYCQVLVAPETP